MELYLILIIVGVLFVTFTAILARYKRCPSDKVLVIYGKTGRDASAKCIHGGAAFIWPVFQSYQFLDLTPISIECNLTNALSKQNIRVDVPCRFTVGISTEPESMTNAAERLLGLNIDDIRNIATDILFGQLRLVIATMDIEEINADRDKFLANVSTNVEAELRKIGLKLINVNVTDIRDESGYIEALGKEAAAKAINDAKKSVAEQNRYGETGKAVADKDTRINVAAADADAVKGENTAKIEIANSDAQRREKQAEAERLAVAAEKVQAAKALEEAYKSERDAELARAEREKATQQANIVVSAQIEKEKAIIEAEAEAEQLRRKAKGEADAIFAKMDAQARGTLEILAKQAEGFGQLVAAAGGDAQQAITMLITDKLPELVKTQVEAVKGINIDKVTVWDSGKSENGKTATANFVSGLMGSVPPLEELFKMAGMSLPGYLKGEAKEAPAPAEEVKPAE
ncbi:MAG: flotillin family protein [Bacteroidales bacterium]|jgi:flotillin|nr:flotillin family protein [Bacteroidales bacterium]MBO7575133.1 flotillin family protein [Bacteroidales bacterium]